MNQQEQIDKNTSDIGEIKQTLHTISTNHLYHLEKDMEKQSKLIERMDMRLWAVLMLMVAGVVINYIGG